MHAGNLEDKGKISLLHEQREKYEVYIPPENKRMVLFDVLKRLFFH